MPLMIFRKSKSPGLWGWYESCETQVSRDQQTCLKHIWIAKIQKKVAHRSTAQYPWMRQTPNRVGIRRRPDSTCNCIELLLYTTVEFATTLVSALSSICYPSSETQILQIQSKALHVPWHNSSGIWYWYEQGWMHPCRFHASPSEWSARIQWDSQGETSRETRSRPICTMFSWHIVIFHDWIKIIKHYLEPRLLTYSWNTTPSCRAFFNRNGIRERVDSLQSEFLSLLHIGSSLVLIDSCPWESDCETGIDQLTTEERKLLLTTCQSEIDNGMGDLKWWSKSLTTIWIYPRSRLPICVPRWWTCVSRITYLRQSVPFSILCPRTVWINIKSSIMSINPPTL